MSSKPSKLPWLFPLGDFSSSGGGGGGPPGGGGGGDGGAGGSVLIVPAAASSSGSSQGKGSTISSTGTRFSSSSGGGCTSSPAGFGSLISIRRSVMRPLAAIGKSGAHAGGAVMIAMNSSREPNPSGTSHTNWSCRCATT